MLKLTPIVIDNWYSKEELNNIFLELDYYQKTAPIKLAQDYCADDENKVPKAKSLRLYPNNMWIKEERKMSFILRYQDKFKESTFHRKIESISNIYDLFWQTNWDNTIISYYQNNDFYKKHNDLIKYTALIWVYKEPKQFEGGDLIFNDLNKTIECRNNRLVLFPGFLYHEVTTIKSKKKIKNGYGRYCITHFYNNI